MKTLKFFLTVLVFFSAWQSSMAQTYFVKSGSGVNLRSGKGTETSVVEKIPDNAEVKVLSKDGEWWKVEHQGKTGYLKPEFLAEKKTDKPQQSQVKKEESKEETKPSVSLNGTCFGEGTQLIGIGVGLPGGSYYRGYSYGNYTTSPSFSITYEQPWKDKLGPGYLGVGGYFGYRSAKYRYDYNYYNYNYYYQHKWNYFMIAARAAYHLDILNKEKAEVYAGALLGARIQTYNYTTSDPYDYGYSLNEGSYYLTYSAFVGARWYFAKNMALFGEAGYGISYITGGVNFRF